MAVVGRKRPHQAQQHSDHKLFPAEDIIRPINLARDSRRQIRLRPDDKAQRARGLASSFPRQALCICPARPKRESSDLLQDSPDQK